MMEVGQVQVFVSRWDRKVNLVFSTLSRSRGLGRHICLFQSLHRCQLNLGRLELQFGQNNVARM